MSLSVLLLILIIGVSLFFIPARSVLVVSTMIAAIIVPLLLMSGTYVYATPSNPAYYVMGSICHRIYLGMAGFSILLGTAIAFPIEKLEKYGKSLCVSGLIFFAIATFVYGHAYVSEREQLWREQGKVSKDIVERIKKRKDNVSKHLIIYLIGKPLSFIQSMFRLYIDNGDLIVKIIDSPDKISDPSAYVLKIVEIDS